MKLSFSDKITIFNANDNTLVHYIGITITNIGNREVFIKNWGFCLNDDTINFIVPDTSALGKFFQVKLLYKLQIEESITLQYETNLFCKSLEIYISASKLKPNKKLNSL